LTAARPPAATEPRPAWGGPGSGPGRLLLSPAGGDRPESRAASDRSNPPSSPSHIGAYRRAFCARPATHETCSLTSRLSQSSSGTRPGGRRLSMPTLPPRRGGQVSGLGNERPRRVTARGESSTAAVRTLGRSSRESGGARGFPGPTVACVRLGLTLDCWWTEASPAKRGSPGPMGRAVTG
jgi:hypothetical protein